MYIYIYIFLRDGVPFKWCTESAIVELDIEAATGDTVSVEYGSHGVGWRKEEPLLYLGTTLGVGEEAL